MALRYYRNKHTGEQKASLKGNPDPDTWEELLVAPDGKFMERVDPEKGKSRQKGLNKILTERARNHAREADLDDTIQVNRANGLENLAARGLLNEKGERRTRLDDI